MKTTSHSLMASAETPAAWETHRLSPRLAESLNLHLSAPQRTDLTRSSRPIAAQPKPGWKWPPTMDHRGLESPGRSDSHGPAERATYPGCDQIRPLKGTLAYA